MYSAVWRLAPSYVILENRSDPAGACFSTLPAAAYQVSDVSAFLTDPVDGLVPTRAAATITNSGQLPVSGVNRANAPLLYRGSILSAGCRFATLDC